MIFHENEYQLAKKYTQEFTESGLEPQQIKQIRTRGLELAAWYYRHTYLHTMISLLNIAFFFLADYLLLLWFPRLFLDVARANDAAVIVLTAISVSLLKGWTNYALIHYSLHEGAAHDMIFPRRNGPTNWLGTIANNLCRLFFCDPIYFAHCHNKHHAYFGTRYDEEFLNFVLPSRFWKSLMPFSAILAFNDFVTHRPLKANKSVVMSYILSFIYHGIYAVLVWRSFGPIFTLLVAFCSPNISLYLDRVRQFSEHNLLPLDNDRGARSFGVGFWGLLIGGGPWGQPCHWMHHLVPAIPWYQQIQLHRFVKRLLTAEQRRQFMLQPGLGFPRLLWRLWHEPAAFSRAHSLHEIETNRISNLML